MPLIFTGASCWHFLACEECCANDFFSLEECFTGIPRWTQIICFEFDADFVGREARSCLQKLGGGIPGNVAAEPGLNCKYKSKLCIGSLVFKLKKMCSVSAFNFLGSDVVVGEEPYILQSCWRKKKKQMGKREIKNF